MSSHAPVCIMVDTGSDMLPEEAEKYNIHLIPLKVRFGEEEFDDGFTLSRDEFYRRMAESGTIPKTSLVSPQRYGDCFSQAVEAGFEVVCLTLSSGISGSCQSARIAAEDFPGKVRVVDTLQFCGSEYLLALRAAELRDSGLDAASIAAAIEEERTAVKIVALFDTLEYLRLGGRVSPAAACVGGILSIKPVLTIRAGKVCILGKARGSRNGNNHLMRFVHENGGIDWNRPVLLSWSGTSDYLLDKYVEDSAGLYVGHDPSQMLRSRVGATIGTYTGPGAIALSFFPKK